MSLESAGFEARIAQLEHQLEWVTRQRDEFSERTTQLASYVDELTAHRSGITPARSSEAPRGITFIVAAYNIPRQIRRTLLTLTPGYQGFGNDSTDGTGDADVDVVDVQVIVVDNGSDTPLETSDLDDVVPGVELIRVDGHPSPVFGLNKAIESARHDTIAMMIDGAHLLSPGVIRSTMEIRQLFENPVINVPQYLLGAEAQNLLPDDRPDPFETETADLAEMGWPEQGYSLFTYALKATEVADRNPFQWAETNCLITTREVLERCGGFDERFDEPGAGMANVEFFHRLTHDPDNQYVLLAGEGSFHQDHHGTTTGVSVDVRKERVDRFHQRNEELFGYRFPALCRSPFVYGVVRNDAQTVPTISTSYGIERGRVLANLAKIYVDHLVVGQEPPRLHLTSRVPQDEHVARPPLTPTGLLEPRAEAIGVTPADLDYLGVLARLHELRKPKLYLEIGVDNGNSMRLAKCARVGLDPDFELTMTQAFPTKIFKIRSDSFFANEGWCANHLKGGVDLAYVDGMHLSEYVLRDIINTERWMNEDGLIVVDDVFPDRMEMAGRERDFAAWCGDVYRVVPILREYRPDLTIQVVEAFAGPYRKGLAMISGLKPGDPTLVDAYDEIEQRLADGDFTATSIEELASWAQPVPLPDAFAVLGHTDVFGEQQ